MLHSPPYLYPTILPKKNNQFILNSDSGWPQIHGKSANVVGYVDEKIKFSVRGRIFGQYSEEKRKEIDKQCKISGLAVIYTSCTEPGNSGSPVVDDEAKLLCLHSGAVVQRNKHNQRLTIDAKPPKEKSRSFLQDIKNVWKDTDPPEKQWCIGNYGVPIFEILKDLQKKHSALLYQLFSEWKVKAEAMEIG